MKCSAVLAALTMTVAALAAPAEIVERTGGGGGGTNVNACNNQQKQVCCGFLGCGITLLGAGCSGSSYCCETDGATVSIIHFK